MEDPAKGTVTPFASMFPVDEAQKAAKRVEDNITEKQEELHGIKEFIADNANLINIVSRLPDELHHDIMVPFGKAAFFPGRLIHTNEFMVLLGEGYYVERTSKQTMEILKRRGKALDSQVESLIANVKDLRAEASFFDATASETAEGLVEIREDYVEENSVQRGYKSDDKKVTVEDDEYARIMSRLDELEKEELAAEEVNENNEDEESNTAETESDNESDENEQTNAAESESDGHDYMQTKADFNQFAHQTSSECTRLTVQPISRDEILNDKRSTHNVKESVPSEKALVLPEVKEKFEAGSSSRNEVPMQAAKSGFDSSKAFTGSIVERIQPATSSQSSKPRFDSSKAFTCSTVESNIQPTSEDQTSSDPKPSKPASRFKMQRAGRQ